MPQFLRARHHRFRINDGNEMESLIEVEIDVSYVEWKPRIQWSNLNSLSPLGLASADCSNELKSLIVSAVTVRRRRSLISAQGSSIARTLGHNFKMRGNPERVRRLANPFRVQ